MLYRNIGEIHLKYAKTKEKDWNTVVKFGKANVFLSLQLYAIAIQIIIIIITQPLVIGQCRMMAIYY